MAELTNEQVRSLDQTRQRLLALHTSLTALRSDLVNPQQPLPAWSSLQTHANLISDNLQQIAGQLTEYQQLLASTVVYPLPQFPGRAQDAILQALLRTNLEPDVKEWVAQGQSVNTVDGKASQPMLSDRDKHELWQWAPSAANAEARKQKWGADYTLAEKQTGVDNVKTGLRRRLIEPADDTADDSDEFDEESEEEEEDVEEEDVDDEEGDDAMDVDLQAKTSDTHPRTTSINAQSPTQPSLPQMPLESVHRFMTTGKVG